MKTKKQKGLWNLVLIISGLLSLTSCDENQIDIFGEAKVKVVNAAVNSRTQEFFFINYVIARDLNYAQSTNSYITVKSGDNLVARFINQDNGSRYASEEINLNDKDKYTIYLAEDANNNGKIYTFRDNLSSPSNGKAKIKFIHLSDSAPSAVLFTNNSDIASNVTRNRESEYFEVNAGSIFINAKESGQNSNLASIQTPQLIAGKTYTIVLCGTYNDGYDLLLVRHN